MVYRSSLVPVTCSQAITPLALPVLTPDMVLVRPFCPGTPGDKMHHLEARYPPPPRQPQGNLSDTSWGSRIPPMQTRMCFSWGCLPPECMGPPGPPDWRVCLPELWQY